MAAMNPHTATREQFTNNLLDAPIPDEASEDWKLRAQQLKDLLRKLMLHPAMIPNLQQTYMTPASPKNKVYFMWDFVGRTLGMLYQIPSTRPYDGTNEAWSDVASRSVMAAQLILDERPGMLDMMVSSTYPGLTQSTIRFDEETKEISRRLTTN